MIKYYISYILKLLSDIKRVKWTTKTLLSLKNNLLFIQQEITPIV